MIEKSPLQAYNGQFLTQYFHHKSQKCLFSSKIEWCNQLATASTPWPTWRPLDSMVLVLKAAPTVVSWKPHTKRQWNTENLHDRWSLCYVKKTCTYWNLAFHDKLRFLQRTCCAKNATKCWICQLRHHPAGPAWSPSVASVRLHPHTTWLALRWALWLVWGRCLPLMLVGSSMLGMQHFKDKSRRLQNTNRKGVSKFQRMFVLEYARISERVTCLLRDVKKSSWYHDVVCLLSKTLCLNLWRMLEWRISWRTTTSSQAKSKTHTNQKLFVSWSLVSYLQ